MYITNPRVMFIGYKTKENHLHHKGNALLCYSIVV